MIIKYAREILFYIAMSAGLIILYITMLVAGEAIPKRLVVDNAMQSYLQLKDLGLYFEGVDGAGWDNWTDTYFINAAVTEYEGNWLQKALANAYTSGSSNVIDDIQYAIDNDDSGVVIPYSRYWAGMRTIYKILLIFMPINSIRALVFAVVLILFVMSVLCVYKKLGAKGLIPYLVSVVLVQFIPQAMCLVFNTDIGIMFLMMVICFRLTDKKASAKAFYILFFLAGSVLAYLNYWAFPLITLGYPLVFVIAVRLIEGYSMQRLTKETVLMSVSWGTGLIGTVLVKQILCSIVLGAQSGTDQLLLRMGSEYTINDRLIAVTNGLVDRMTSMPVLILTVIVSVWMVVMLKTGVLKRQYGCILFILVALYPVLWWFVLPNHCVHGFVRHMYGVSYYALLSACLINCESFIPDFRGSWFKRSIGINIGVFAVWLLLTYCLFHVNIHYSSRETEPWSMETIGTADLGEGRITQEIHFEDFQRDRAYLKNLSTILVNLPEDKKDGTLRVEFVENGDVIRTAEIQIGNAPVGDWIPIPIRCVIAPENTYQVIYTVYGNEKSEPYLLIQDQSQATRENDMLYINERYVDGAIANKYEVDEYLIPEKAKLCIALIILVVMEYGVSLFQAKEGGNGTIRWKNAGRQEDRNR